jgi:hypothetical protein
MILVYSKQVFIMSINLPIITPLTIISGGQTGADLAGLVAAHAIGIPTTGWAPKGFKTERGPQKILGQRYGLIEHANASYNPRTVENVKASDFTIILSPNPDSKGTVLTRETCIQNNTAFEIYTHLDDTEASGLLAMLQLMSPQVINIAGNRESVARGLTKKGRAFLEPVLRQYHHDLVSYTLPKDSDEA